MTKDEEFDAQTLAVAPGPGDSFWALSPNGHVRRRSFSGDVLEDLGIATPFSSGLDAVPRVEPITSGVVVGSRAGLVAVTRSGSRELISAEALDRAKVALRDFAVDASGERSAVAGPSLDGLAIFDDWDYDANPDGPQWFDDIVVFEGTAMRRVARVREGRATIALDPSARSIAVAESTSIHSDPGSVEIIDFASGQARWRRTGCRGPLLYFLSDGSLVAGITVEPDEFSGIAMYDADSGELLRRAAITDRAFAISVDGSNLIVENTGGPAMLLELQTGSATSLGTTWVVAYGWWCSAPGLLIDHERGAFPIWRNTPPATVIALREVPWADQHRSP
jgi:hypothetical protein